MGWVKNRRAYTKQIRQSDQRRNCELISIEYSPTCVFLKFAPPIFKKEKRKKRERERAPFSDSYRKMILLGSFDSLETAYLNKRN